MRKSDLQIMQEMAKIKPESVLVSTRIVELKKHKGGGKVIFEITDPLYTQLSKQFGTGKVTHYPMMIIPEKELFDKVSEE